MMLIHAKNVFQVMLFMNLSVLDVLIIVDNAVLLTHHCVRIAGMAIT